MDCCNGPLVGTLKNLICGLEGCPPPECAPPPPYYPAPLSPPHIMCCHVRPPPICAPTQPEPVKPLRLPCQTPPQRRMSDGEAELVRFSNFYNAYNVDWHAESPCNFDPNFCDPRVPMKCTIGVCLDGKLPCFPKCPKPPCCDNGCPTGFKPCKMMMVPPSDRHPCGLWKATILDCKPKGPKKVYGKFVPARPCGRFCCIHTDPAKCKASCFSR